MRSLIETRKTPPFTEYFPTLNPADPANGGTSGRTGLSYSIYLWTKFDWLALPSSRDTDTLNITKVLVFLCVFNINYSPSFDNAYTKDIIFHSDKGSQYCSDKIVKLLKSLKFKQSMSGRGNCYDNAVTETFFSTLKKELVYQCKYNTRTEAKNSIFEYIEVDYNRYRRHSAIGFISPERFEARNVC